MDPTSKAPLRHVLRLKELLDGFPAMASVQHVRCQGGFGRKPTAEKSRSTLVATLALLSGIPFRFVNLGGVRAFCTGHTCGLHRPLAPIRRSNCRPRRLKTAEAAAEARSRVQNSQSHEPDPRVLASKKLTFNICSAEFASQILQLVGEEVDGEVFMILAACQIQPEAKAQPNRCAELYLAEACGTAAGHAGGGQATSAKCCQCRLGNCSALWESPGVR